MCWNFNLSKPFLSRLERFEVSRTHTEVQDPCVCCELVKHQRVQWDWSICCDCHSDSHRVCLISLFFGRCLHFEHWAGFSDGIRASWVFFPTSFVQWKSPKTEIRQKKSQRSSDSWSHFLVRLRLCQCQCNVVGMLSLSGSIKLILSPALGGPATPNLLRESWRDQTPGVGVGEWGVNICVWVMAFSSPSSVYSCLILSIARPLQAHPSLSTPSFLFVICPGLWCREAQITMTHTPTHTMVH